jgi:hypothetical protein
MTEKRQLVVPSERPESVDQALVWFIRGELIESTEGGYRFLVELVRCWFARC